MEEPLELLEDILVVSMILARGKLRAHPALRQLGIDVRGHLLSVALRFSVCSERLVTGPMGSHAGASLSRHVLGSTDSIRSLYRSSMRWRPRSTDDLKYRQKLRIASSSGFEVS